MVLGTIYLVLGVVLGTWYGTWYLVWYLVLGAWYLVRYLVLDLVLGTWCGTWYFVLGKVGNLGKLGNLGFASLHVVIRFAVFRLVGVNRT